MKEQTPLERIEELARMIGAKEERHRIMEGILAENFDRPIWSQIKHIINPEK